MEPNDNAPVAEAVSAPTTESTAAPQAPGSEEVPVKEATVEPTVVDDPVALRKELEKARMEANLHKNKVEKFEKEKEVERQAQLTREEQLAEKVAEYEAKEARRDAENFRNGVIDEYLANDPAALKAAKALIARNPGNLAWGQNADGSSPTEDEAKADLIAQLDDLKTAIGSVAPAPEAPQAPAQSPVHANNPAGTETPADVAHQTAIAQAQKTGDWSKVIGNLKTVQFQRERLS